MIQSRSGAEIEIVNTAAGMSTSALYSNLGVTSGSINSSGTQNAPASFTDIASTLNPGFGGISVISNPNAPSAITNLAASWSGDDLVITFNFDTTDPLNQYFNYFNIYLSPNGSTTTYNWNPQKSLVNTSSTSQSFKMTTTIAQSIFNGTPTDFKTIGVSTEDVFMNESAIVSIPGPAYSNGLPAPTVTISSINNGYSVAYTNPTQTNFYGIEVYECETNSTSETSGMIYNLVYSGKLNPITIVSPNQNARLVKARFLASNNTYGTYSTAVSVTPTSPVRVNVTVPTEVTSSVATWSGNDISLSFTMPSTNAGTKFIVALTASNQQVGYFYFYPIGTNLNQTHVITKADLFNQFGAYFPSFSGIIQSASSVDQRSSGVSFTVSSRPNLLVGYKPEFTVTGVANGYTVTWDITHALNSSGVSTAITTATHAEVYLSSSTLGTTFPLDDSYLVYSGTSPVTIPDTSYTLKYIKIRYYDDFDSNSADYGSLNSDEKTVQSYDPGQLSLISNPIKISTNGSIFAGAGDKTVYPQVFFNKDGLFAYDAGGNPTTEIVNSATNGSPTFFTTSAQIADWSIKSNTIQNDMHISGSNYTGLSASGTYAFWAGSAVSGGDTTNFAIKPDGTVYAHNITISGGSVNVGNFSVNTAGKLIATDAEITGKITASSGAFSGNVSIASGGSLYSGTLNSNGDLVSGSSGYTLNSSGLTFRNPSTAGVTTIDAATGTLTTKLANIGGWNVDSYTINKAGVTLDSSTPTPSISAIKGAYSTGITAPSSNNATSDIILWAGQSAYSVYTDTRTSAGFRVQADGTMFADKAYITGTVSASGPSYKIQMDPTPNNEYLSFGTSSTINGLIYTRTSGSTSYIVMEPTSTTTFSSYGKDSISGLILSGSPALIMSNSGGGNTNVVLGIAGASVTTYTINGKTYAPPTNQYIKFGPTGVQMTTFSYIGNLTDTLSASDGSYVSTVNSDPFVRVVIQSPYLADGGQLKTGFAVYYGNNRAPAASSSNGLVGDIWLEF
jgi:hypothetical protein